jgi:pimeloyl-ACP methyl ester carboxylesterase
MTAAEVSERFQAIPFVPGDTAARVELHSGLSRYYPKLHGNLVARAGASRAVGFILVHPSSNFLTHFLLRPMAAAGLPVMALNTRYSGNEAALIMESAALDLGAGVRWMREEVGFEKVAVVGFSGGGSLASFYQSQASRPTVTATPAGDPVDLTGLVPADAVILCAAHVGRAAVLANWIDPSVLDEQDPYGADPALDLYAPGRGVPLATAWVAAYRAAQRARIKRISDWAREQLAEADRRGIADRAFTVQRTVADPRFIDLTLDPSDREPGSMYGDPRVANQAAGGLARFTTARSWLSTWSIDDTNAYAPRDLAAVKSPVLVMCLNADQAAFPSESAAMAAAVPGGGAELAVLPGLNHYLVGQPGAVGQVVGGFRDWALRTGLLSG